MNATRRVRPQRARHNLHPTTKRSAQHEVVHNHSNHGLIHRILRIQSCETRSWHIECAAANVHIRVSFSQPQRISLTADGAVNHHACRTKPLANCSSRGISCSAIEYRRLIGSSRLLGGRAVRPLTPYKDNPRWARAPSAAKNCLKPNLAKIIWTFG